MPTSLSFAPLIPAQQARTKAMSRTILPTSRSTLGSPLCSVLSSTGPGWALLPCKHSPGRWHELLAGSSRLL